MIIKVTLTEDELLSAVQTYLYELGDIVSGTPVKIYRIENDEYKIEIEP